MWGIKMDNSRYIFRLKELKMKDFMSVEFGRISFSDIDKEYDEDDVFIGSSVTGIYGTNGSGKTTVVKAVETFLEAIWIQGNKEAYLNVPFINRKKADEKKENISLVRNGSDYASLSFTFHILYDEKPTHKLLTYVFSFKMNPAIEIFDEKITLTDSDNSKEMVFSSEKFLTSKGYAESLLKTIVKNNENEKLKKLIEAHSELAQKRKKNKFLFYELINTIGEDYISSDMGELLVAFRHEMCANMIPIDDDEISRIRSCEGGFFLLGYFDSPNTEKVLSFWISCDDGRIIFEPYENPTLEEEERLAEVINGINQVLDVILKDTHIVSVKENGIYYLKIRKNNDMVVSFNDESYGIRKIIILTLYLALLFVNPRLIVVIDELDEGLFEYLLGKILKVIQKYAQGQLIFTAHNLRPLEVLPHDCIRFAIPNESNRKNVKNLYRKLTKTNSNSNLREVYYRLILSHNTDSEEFAE